ncbi:MAG: sugar transferase [Caulobacteraceae bacterium]|nr:sugar transferase [Caulobacteraceae bacterium]
MQEKSKASEESASAAAPVRAPVARANTPRLKAITPPVPPAIAEARQPVEVVRKTLEPGTAALASPVGGWSKRAFDIFASSSALIVLAPLLVATAIAVKMDSPGDAIFQQERGGFGGKTFRILKFRTMSVMENRGVVQAVHHDARITRLGAFLRRSSWDELPQLLNVLKGDMSIIGPRPHALEHDIHFQKVELTYAERFSARPGVTGLAQVNGCRGPTETVEKIKARTKYDVEYVRNWTWWREVEIVAATVALLFWKKDPGAL